MTAADFRKLADAATPGPWCFERTADETGDLCDPDALLAHLDAKIGKAAASKEMETRP